MVTEGADLRIRDCHPLWCAFPDTSAGRAFVTPLGFRNPDPKVGLGYSAFARRYLRSLG